MQLSLKFLEKTNRDNKHISFYVYKISGEKDTAMISHHWHNELEILYCLIDGVCELDGATIAFKKGDILFINKDVLHYVKADCDGLVFAILFKYNVFEFTKQDFCQSKILNKLENGNLRFPNKIDFKNEIYDELTILILETIGLYFNDTIGGELKAKGDFYNMLFLFYNTNQFIAYENSKKDSEQTGVGYVRNTIGYIEQNFSSNIKISDLAKNANISSFYLIKVFKQFTNITPIQYLIDYRLEYATTLLKEANSITTICYETGFNSMSYFIKKFKEKYGVTPKEYKI